MPSSRAATAALRSILDHANEAQSFIEGQTRESFRTDRLRFHAVTRCLEIVSEASRRIDPSIKAKWPTIPWRNMAGAGNLYRHDYDNVESDLVWKTASEDLTIQIVFARAELAEGHG